MFRFLSFGGEGARFLGFRGRGGTQSAGWLAAGGMHRPGLGECTGAGYTTRSLKKLSKNPLAVKPIFKGFLCISFITAGPMAVWGTTTEPTKRFHYRESRSGN